MSLFHDMDNNLSNPNLRPDGAVLAEYLAGRATGGERASVEKWLEGDTEATAELQLLDRARLSANKPIDGDVDRFVLRIQRELVRENTRKPGRYRTAGIGALVALAAAFLFAAIYLPKNKDVPDTTVYTTENGQRAKITLADGSTAVLAPATTLRAKGREITLNGEAMFTVVQHGSSPFTVRTGTVLTRVLGTTFAVRAYENQIRVAVSDGRVSVQSNSIEAGDVATIKTGGMEIKRGSDVSSFFSFASGKLSFNNQVLSEVIPDLERWYNVDVQVMDKRLLAQRVDGVFPGTSASELMETFEFLFGARVVRDGRVIKVYAN